MWHFTNYNMYFCIFYECFYAFSNSLLKFRLAIFHNKPSQSLWLSKALYLETDLLHPPPENMIYFRSKLNS